MPVFFGQSQTVSIQTVTDTAGGYGSTILASTSSSYALVGAVTLTFSVASFRPVNGMKLYVECTCAIQADSSSATSVILQVDDGGTVSNIDASEAQSDLVAGTRIVTLLGSYTIAHCGTTAGGAVTVRLMGKRVVGSGTARVINPITLRARLARD